MANNATGNAIQSAYTGTTGPALLPSGQTSGAADFAAITAALALGQPVRLGAGTFWTNQVIQIPANATLVGAGAQLTTIKMAAGANLAAVAATSGWTTSANTSSVFPAYIRGITFDGNTSGQSSGTGHGLVLQTFESYIEDCAFQNTRGDGLRFDSRGANGTTALGNTAVENRVVLCRFITNGGNGFNVNDPSNATLTDGWLLSCVVSTSTQRGINIDAGAGWVVEGNHAYGIGFSGIAVGSAFESRIFGNYVEDWGTSGTSGSYAAIDLAGTYFLNDGGQGSAVTGNTINLNAAPGNAATNMWGIAAEATSGGTGTVAITGNVLTASDNTHPANYTGIILIAQSNTSTLNAITAGNQIQGHWGAGKVAQFINGGTMNAGEAIPMPSGNALIVSTDGTATSNGAVTANPGTGFTGVYNSSTALYYGVATQVPTPAGTAGMGGYYHGVAIGGTSSSGNNPIFGVLNSAQSGNGVGAVAFTITDTNVVDTFNNVLDNGSGAATVAGLQTLNGGTKTSGSAPILTALGAASGTAIQLSDLTRDYMVYLEVTTAGTVTSLTMGHTSAASDVTIVSSVSVSVGQLWSFRLPAGWWFKWTGTTTAIGNQNAVGC